MHVAGDLTVLFEPNNRSAKAALAIRAETAMVAFSVEQVFKFNNDDS